MNEAEPLTDEQMDAVTDAIGWVPGVPWRERVVDVDGDDDGDETDEDC